MTGFEVYKVIGIYLIAVYLVGFFMMGIDKLKAKKRGWRIPEATLFIIALIGGSVGSIIGMHLFRHKTKHWYFVWGMPAILLLHLTAALLIYRASF